MNVLEARTMDAVQEMNRKMPEVELRDLFAMNAISMWQKGSAFINHDFDYIAEQAYKMADAMLKARKEV